MADWQPGLVLLDLYEVRSLLGKGGMGEVYKVYHRAWNLELAVKKVSRDIFATSGTADKFVQEAETWVNLGLHPHLATCFYVRLLDGSPIVFAEYVDGGTLREWIVRRTLYSGSPAAVLARILDVGIQMAWGLHQAHVQGVVHRDVKPDNVLLTQKGMVKITDFGLSRSVEARQGDTEHRYSARHASPEQYPRAPILTPATDVWSWAVCLEEMFLREPPYKGPVAGAVLEAWLERTPLEERVMPPGVIELLRHCFQQTPSARPQSLLDAACVLEEVYQEALQAPYPRPRPVAALQLAGSYNNRGVSLLDLDRLDSARSFLEAALETAPGHLNATYNLGLLSWRQGRLTDVELLAHLSHLANLGAAEGRVKQLLARIHMERGDRQTADFLRTEAARTGYVDEPELTAPGVERVCVLSGHAEFVHCVFLRRDGRMAVSGGRDGLVCLWDLDAGPSVRTLRGHKGPVWGVALTSAWVLSAGHDGTVRVWDWQGHCAKTLENHKGAVRALCVEAGRVASGCDGGVVCCWDLGSGDGFYLPSDVDPVRAMALSPDGLFLAVARTDSVVVWDLRTQERVWRVDAVCQGLAWDAELLTAEEDRVVKRRRADSGEVLGTLTGHTAPCQAVAVAGSRAVSVGRDGTARIWELVGGRCWRTLTEDRGWLNAVSLTPDGRRMATGAADGTVTVWHLPAGQFRAIPQFSRPRRSEEVLSVADKVTTALTQARQAAADGHWAEAVQAVAAARETAGHERTSECLQVWRELADVLPRGAFREVWPLPSLEGHDGSVTAVAVSPGGEWALTGGEDASLRLWDLGRGQCERVLRHHVAPIVSVHVQWGDWTALSLDQSGRVVRWDVHSGTVQSSVEEPVQRVAVTPDGHTAVVLATATTIQFETLGHESGHIEIGCTALAVRADGLLAATGTEAGSVHLWSLPGAARVGVLRGHTGPIRSLRFSGDGLWLFSASEDATARIFEVAPERCVKVLKGHQRGINSLSVSADLAVVVTGGKDRSVRVWDSRSGAAVAVLTRHTQPVLAVDVAANGRHIMAGGRDGAFAWYIDWNIELP